MKIETRTTGFASPAADYARERLVLCEEKVSDPYFTFFFRVGTEIHHQDFVQSDIIVVSRMIKPRNGQLCVGVNGGRFVVYEFGQQVKSHWGVITEIMPGI